MNWLKNASGGNISLRENRKHEPGVTSSALENHWKQAKDVILKSQDPEAAIAVISHFNQMISLLRLSRDDTTAWQKCKDFWLKNRCSDNAIKWLCDLGAQRCDKDDLKLVHALQSLLELASEDGQLLGYFISPNVDSSTSTSRNNEHRQPSPSSSRDGTWDGTCSLSTLLLELCISVDSRVNEAARKSFVLLIQLASKYPELENGISPEARLGVTNMTISGLSACFAQLPTFSPASGDQLQPFIQQLHFVDSVVHAATEALSITIADCFSKNFLYAVILPALTQDEGSRSLHTRDDQNDYVRSVHEEIAVVTSYLQIVCENVTHPLLIRSLMSFVLNQLLTTLLHRMNHPSTAVTVATLSLLNVLLEFYCEDLWYEMVLRYLMPQNHLMVSQRYHRLPEVDFQDAALRFVSLLPTSVTDVLGAETISDNFSQYVQGEVVRWCAIDGISHPTDEPEPDIVAAMQLQRRNSATSNSLVESETPESTNHNSLSMSSSVNTTFRSWRYRYDGTDKVEGSCPPKSLVNLRSNSITSTSSAKDSSSPPQLRHDNETESDQGSRGNETTEESAPAPVVDPLSEDRFTTVSLQGGPNTEEMNSIGIGMSETSFDSEIQGSSSNGISSNSGGGATVKRFNDSSVTDHHSDGYSSMESGGVVDSVASFGPFVDCLFNHLTNFTKLEPDVVLMVTELVSTLTASRIPLISSLFIDHNLTLQPSFRSFLLILNRVRLELDKNVRSQQQLITEVWGQMSREQARLEQESGIGTTGHHSSLALTDSGSFHSPFGENFTDNLRSKINSNPFVAAVSAVFHRKSQGSPSATMVSNNSGDQSPQGSMQSVGNTGQRYVSGRPGSAETRRGSYQEVNRIMVTRAIFFTHWLLELSAISTQLCWRRGDDGGTTN